MSKKKVAKLGLTAAVAATTFVAANPADAASVSQAEQAVKKAEQNARGLVKFYSSEDLKVSAEFTASYNNVRKLISDAKAQLANYKGKDKSQLEAILASAENHQAAAARYIDAVGILNGKLVESTKAVSAYIKSQELNADTVAAYDTLSAEIKKAEAVIGKVRGAQIRKAFKDSFLLDAKLTREALIYEVSQYQLLNQINEKLKAEKVDLKEVQADFAKLDRLKERAVDIKKAGKELYPDRDDVYPTHTAIEQQLRKSEADAKEAYVAKLDPVVESVSVINAKQIEITFNKAVDKDTVLNDQGTKDTSDDVLLATAVDIKELDGQLAPKVITEGSAKASLSADGKTLTITAQTTEYFDGRYTVVVTDNVKAVDKKAFSKATFNINADDKTRPTLKGVTYKDYVTANVEFSEQIATAGTITYKLANGNDLAVNPTATVVDGKIKLDLTAVTDNDKDIIVTIVGAQDFRGNAVSPNPITVSVKKSTADDVKPTVESITATGNKSFDIKFSEKLIADPTISNVGGQVVTLTKDVNDATLYHATLASSVSGLQTVSVTAFADLSNKAGDAYSKVVNFSADEIAPLLTSSKVEKIDGIEYLVLTYNKNVVPTDAVAIDGTYLDNYVSTPMSPTLTTETASPAVANAPFTLYKPVDGKSNSVKLDLSALTKSAEYTVELDKGLVKDLFGNDSAEVKNFKFTRTSNVSTNAPKVDGVTPNALDNNKITISFDRAIDGASAINATNYQVEGATVEKAVLVNNSTTFDVELTLAKDSNNASGARTVSVSGVKSQAGTVMETYTTTANLVENVRPTIAKAELTSDSVITLTFSENVYNAAAGADVDFELLVGGTKVTGATLDTEDVVKGSAKKTLTLTLSGYTLKASDLDKLSVKAVSDTDIKDANDNAYAASTVTVKQ
ncbi:hypothetical protein ABET41_15355 [Metabacillus fastidiosus]|uniref:hypothetical protein n=1 Tax=Metabacillus fastidiosus TaxID=1458 RepID=UPI003D2B782B